MTRNEAFTFANRLFDANATPVRLDELSPAIQSIAKRAAKPQPRSVVVVTKPKSGRTTSRIITVGRR